jgi:hypothetical protein
MGREVKRVPMDFDFPIGASFADAEYNKHCATCDKEDHDDCEWPLNDPPTGEGWQLWQTVSDGPISKVYATADELIDWMCQPVPKEKQTHSWRDPRENPEYPHMPWAQGWRREIAEPFVKQCGWAPSMIVCGGKVMDGATAMVEGLDNSVSNPGSTE